MSRWRQAETSTPDGDNGPAPLELKPGGGLHINPGQGTLVVLSVWLRRYIRKQVRLVMFPRRIYVWFFDR